jgi:hypothetical protein
MSGSSSSGDSTGGGAATGLPCERQDLLEQECQQCHNGSSANTLPALVSYEDLMAPSGANPAVNYAQAAVARMKDAMKPMPPSGLLGAEKVAILEDWLASGSPRGDCEPTGGGAGGGESYDPVCTSEEYWTEGDEGDREMHPGGTCVTCHSKGEGPQLYVGGTVYPTLHEPTDCRGVEAAVITITDANNKVFTLTTNAAGNFFEERDEDESLAVPVTARIEYNGKTLEMKNPVETGDCNSCHSEAGSNGAAGRIVLP